MSNSYPTWIMMKAGPTIAGALPVSWSARADPPSTAGKTCDSTSPAANRAENIQTFFIYLPSYFAHCPTTSSRARPHGVGGAHRVSLSGEQYGPGDQQVQQRQREHQFPGERHELVIARAGHGGPHRNEHAHERHRLEDEPHEAGQPRAQPAAKEERGVPGRYQNDPDVLPEKEQAEFHPGESG